MSYNVLRHGHAGDMIDPRLFDLTNLQAFADTAASETMDADRQTALARALAAELEARADELRRAARLVEIEEMLPPTEMMPPTEWFSMEQLPSGEVLPQEQRTPIKPRPPRRGRYKTMETADLRDNVAMAYKDLRAKSPRTKKTAAQQLVAEQFGICSSYVRRFLGWYRKHYGPEEVRWRTDVPPV